MEICKSRSRNPSRKSRGVKFMLGIKNQRGIQSADMQFIWRFTQQQAQKMRGHAGIGSLGFNALSVLMKLMPVKQHRGKRSQQTIGDLDLVAMVCLWLQATKSRATGSQDVHGVGLGRKLFQDRFQSGGQASEGAKCFAIGSELVGV